MLNEIEEDGDWQTASVQALVVADASLIRWDICEHLRDAGVTPVEASNTDEAIELLDNFEFQVVLTNLLVHSERLIPFTKKVRVRFPALPIVSACGHVVPKQCNDLGVVSVTSFEPAALVREALRVIENAAKRTPQDLGPS